MLLAAPVSVELMLRVRLTSAADACKLSAQRACWWHGRVACQEQRALVNLDSKDCSSMQLSQFRRPANSQHYMETVLVPCKQPQADKGICSRYVRCAADRRLQADHQSSW